jgi:hypothetical protein
MTANENERGPSEKSITKAPAMHIAKTSRPNPSKSSDFLNLPIASSTRPSSASCTPFSKRPHFRQ